MQLLVIGIVVVIVVVLVVVVVGRAATAAISEVPRSVVRCRGFYINAQDMIDELVFDDQGSD